MQNTFLEPAVGAKNRTLFTKWIAPYQDFPDQVKSYDLLLLLIDNWT